MLEDARTEIDAGDTVQGGGKLWGLPATPSRLTAPDWELPTVGMGQRRQAIRDLADRLSNPSLREHFGIAVSCHANFYNDWLEQEDLADYVVYIEELVDIVLGQKVE